MTERIRRNGLLSSCEPCRKSKARCDHARPQCARCVRRGLSVQQCHYHPAPMAQQRKPIREPSPCKSPRTQENPLSRPTSSFPTPASSAPATMTIPVSSCSSPQSESIDRATSFIDIHHSLHAFDESHAQGRTYAALSRNGMSLPQKGLFTPSLVADGVTLLEEILSFTPDSAEPFAFWQANHHGVVAGGIIAKAAWPATHKTLRTLGSQPSFGGLRYMSQEIFANTSKPLKFPATLENGALEDMLFTDIRWDTIGLYCTITGSFYSSDTALYPEYTSAQKIALARRAYFAGMQCEALCQRLDQATDLNLWLLADAMMLATRCFGDDSYHAWRVLGDLSTMIFALGYHKGVSGDQPIPEYVRELRKRIIGLAHELDKESATLVGRPARLGCHHCVMDLPLDLADSAFNSAEDLEAAKAELDQDGWSRDGSIHTATRHRVMLLLSPLREETLELLLGTEVPDLAHRARLLLAKLSSTWHSIPFERQHGLHWDELPLSYVVTMSCSRLEYLYSEFLLHKLLMNHNNSNRAKLITISHEILSLVLSMMKRKAMNRMDLEWVMIFFAMPCASILLLELFRQCSQPQCESILSKSTIVKNLYALISCCDWITESGQSNYEMCKQAQSIFTRALDQILDGDGFAQNIFPAVQGVVVGNLPKQQHVLLEVPDVVVPGGFDQDPEWNAWLESFGLEGEQWLDFSIQSTVNDIGEYDSTV